jgi:hypothetical protein
MDGDVTPQLYTVLPEKSVGIGQSSLLSTNRVYDFQAIKKDQMMTSTSTRTETTGGVDIALNPDELEMNTQALEARYRQELRDKESGKEDLSDMISEHLNKQNKVSDFRSVTFLKCLFLIVFTLVFRNVKVNKQTTILRVVVVQLRN